MNFATFLPRVSCPRPLRIARPWLAVAAAVIMGAGDTSARAQFAPPLPLGGHEATADAPLVVIFYANESDAPSLERMAAWLEQYGSEAAQLSARKMRRDMQMFAPTVARQVADLSAIVAAQPGGRPLHLMVFTNQMARAGQYLYQAAGAASLTAAALNLPATDQQVFAVNPLSRADALEAALLAAAERFSPAQHRFLLIAKSHGSETLALGGLGAAKLGIGSFEDLIAAIQEHEASTAELADMVASSQGTDQNVHDPLDDQNVHDPLDDQAVTDPLDDQGLPFEFQGIDDFASDLSLPAESVGTTKDQFVGTLAAVARRRGMQFDLVVLDSCRSELTATQTAAISPYVSWLVASTGGTHYQSVNYAALGEVAPEFLDALLGALQRAAETRQTGPAPGYDG